ncbi:MAG: putative Holliday junction ATP-dependent helicase RuvA [Planctomycetota bacterium]|jgi:Holliday junction DNA helicase RuvA
MISRIEGVLEDVVDGVAEVRVAGSGLVYEVLVPACDAGDLMMRQGKEIAFVTLHYLESQGQGSHFVPRLIGFSSREQRDFFELLTTVKGIGNRKALRAMQVSHGRMAEAIAAGDAKFLSTLPEIGKRTAESTIVELKGKLDPFLKDPSATRRALERSAVVAVTAVATGPAADAEDVLVALGEQRAQARAKVERVLAASVGESIGADEIVTRALRTRGVQ